MKNEEWKGIKTSTIISFDILFDINTFRQILLFLLLEDYINTI